MTRGDTIIVSLAGDFGKPRPAIVIQSDRLIGLQTVIVCPLTTTILESLPLRPVFEPDAANGLRVRSQAMIDRLMTSRLTRVGSVIGRMSDADMAKLDRMLGFVLGFRER